MHRDPIGVADVLASRVIAWPFHLLECCLVTDGGGALVLVSAERARDFPTRPVYVLGTGESSETPMVSQMEDFTTSRAFRVSGRAAFAEAGIRHDDVDHLMIYDAFAHLPIYGLEDLGFVPRGEAGRFIWDGNTRAGREAPAQHQRRRTLVHAYRHVRHVRAAGERATGARQRARAGAGRTHLGGARRRRDVRGRGHGRAGRRAGLALVALARGTSRTVEDALALSFVQRARGS